MLLRIGDKIVNRQKIHQTVDAILDYRSHGMSQQEVANKFGYRIGYYHLALQLQRGITANKVKVSRNNIRFMKVFTKLWTALCL
jgi:hypothetical protein